MTPERGRHVQEEVTKKLVLALDTLYSVWRELGIDVQQVDDRADAVSRHLCDLMDDLVNEELQLRDRIATCIHSYLDEISSLSIELGLLVPHVEEQLTMVQREKELRTKLDCMTREKQERMTMVMALREQDQSLCDILCATPYYIPTDSVPSQDQLRQLEDHIKAMESEKSKRHKQFLSLRQQILALTKEMDYCPETSFERDLIDEGADRFQLSASNMACLQATLQGLEEKNRSLAQDVGDLWERVRCLWERLDLPDDERALFEVAYRGCTHRTVRGLQEEVIRCERFKHDNIQRFVEGARRELIQQWDRCFFSEQQRHSFAPFHDECYTEQLLERHEEELERMREYHSKHRTVIQMMAARNKLWHEMLEFEKDASDPNRFFNDRGGKLLREERARKKLMKDLPKVEEDSRQQIEEWESRTGLRFLVEGVPFTDYIQRQWTAFHAGKQKQRQDRQMSRVKQIEEEMTFGCKPATPVKRRLRNTPCVTPLKARKIAGNSSVIACLKSKYTKLNDSRMPVSVPSRLKPSSIFRSPCPKAPFSACKQTPSAVNTSRRRSVRQARRVLQEKLQKDSTASQVGELRPGQDLFSQTTVSSGDSGNNNVSLATMGSYHDFATKLNTMSTLSNPGNSTIISAHTSDGSKHSRRPGGPG